jgi:hypothetical protein
VELPLPISAILAPDSTTGPRLSLMRHADWHDLGLYFRICSAVHFLHHLPRIVRQSPGSSLHFPLFAGDAGIVRRQLKTGLMLLVAFCRIAQTVTLSRDFRSC